MSGAEFLAVLGESQRLATLPVVVCSGHAKLAHGGTPAPAGIVEEFCGKP
jgi:hypothetical protein